MGNNGWREGKSGNARATSLTMDMKQDLVRYEVEACVTEQRLDNVLSKTGRVEPRDKAACNQLLDGLKEDVREALEDEDRVVLLNSGALQQELDQLCRKLITKVLLRRF